MILKYFSNPKTVKFLEYIIELSIQVSFMSYLTRNTIS